MKSTDNIYNYSWKAFDKDVEKLCKQIDFTQYEYLVGVATGGLPLLTKLINVTKKPYIIIKCQSYVGKNRRELKIDTDGLTIIAKRVLLVDDVADSGRTLERVRIELNLKGNSAEILTLFYKPQSTVIPEWYVHEVENRQWIQFPWE